MMKSSIRNLPKAIWALGWVSLFMDSSSELIHSLLPIFMSTSLGATMATIGLVEGVAEATASIVKVFSGVLSDHVRRRKFLLVLGYGLAAVTKPIFPLATSMGWVFSARFVDRIGKGIRGAPRDALVADITPPAMRGAAYGLRQSLDSLGAVVGPLLAVAFMAWFADDLRSVLWIAIAPALVAVGWLLVGVHEPEHARNSREGRPKTIFSGAWHLSRKYWFVVTLGALFTLARFSEAFLVLRAQSTGIAIGYVPVVMMVMNVVYSAAAYPAGAAADRFSRRSLLVAGLTALVLSDVVLAAATSPWHAFGGALLWGLHLALTQGLLSKLVADTAPAELRGTAFGLFNLVSGVALLCASFIAGTLWDRIGPPATFMAGAVFAALAAIGILMFHPGAHAGREPQDQPR
jgi:MFS family permease